MSRSKPKIKIEENILFLSDIKNWFVLSSNDIINHMIDNRCYLLVNDYRHDVDFYELNEIETRFQELIDTKNMLLERKKCL